MKPRCPITKCDRGVSSSNGVLCETHWALVPRSFVNEIAQAKAIVRQTRKANRLAAAFRRQRLAKQAAIQYVIDKQNEKVSA